MTTTREAIVTSIANVLEGVAGSIRVLTPGQFKANAHEGLNASRLAVNALVAARYDIIIDQEVPTPVMAKGWTNTYLQEMWFSVLYTFGTKWEGLEDEKRAVRGTAYHYAALAQKALCWPGNLSDDGGTPTPTPTEIASRCALIREPTKLVKED